MNRSELLRKAEEIITKDRATTHGDAEDSFSSIATYWTVFLTNIGALSPGEKINSLAVAKMMALFKIARSDGNAAHEDNWLDLIGYAAIAGEIALKKKDSIGKVVKVDPDKINHFTGQLHDGTTSTLYSHNK